MPSYLWALDWHNWWDFARVNTSLNSPIVFLLTVPRRFFCCSSLFVRLRFHMWCLCSPYLFLISPSLVPQKDCSSWLWYFRTVLRDYDISHGTSNSTWRFTDTADDHYTNRIFVIWSHIKSNGEVSCKWNRFQPRPVVVSECFKNYPGNTTVTKKRRQDEEQTMKNEMPLMKAATHEQSNVRRWFHTWRLFCTFVNIDALLWCFTDKLVGHAQTEHANLILKIRIEVEISIEQNNKEDTQEIPQLRMTVLPRHR